MFRERDETGEDQQEIWVDRRRAGLIRQPIPWQQWTEGVLIGHRRKLFKDIASLAQREF